MTRDSAFFNNADRHRLPELLGIRAVELDSETGTGNGGYRQGTQFQWFCSRWQYGDFGGYRSRVWLFCQSPGATGFTSRAEMQVYWHCP